MCRFEPTGLVPAQGSGSCRSAVVGQLDSRVRAALHDRCRRGAHAPESLGFVACSGSREGAQATFVRAARAHRPGAACVGYRACYRHPFGCCRGGGGACGAPSPAGWKASRARTQKCPPRRPLIRSPARARLESPGPRAPGWLSIRCEWWPAESRRAIGDGEDGLLPFKGETPAEGTSGSLDGRTENDRKVRRAGALRFEDYGLIGDMQAPRWSVVTGRLTGCACRGLTRRRAFQIWATESHTSRPSSATPRLVADS